MRLSLLKPAYDSYIPSIELAGGIAIRVPMQYDAEQSKFYHDWDLVKKGHQSPNTLIDD